MRGGVIAVVVGLVALVAFAGTVPEDASAGHGRPCGIVTKGGKDFQTYGAKMRCKRVRKGARLYLRQRQALPGFSCTREVRNAVFTCLKGERSYRAERL